MTEIIQKKVVQNTPPIQPVLVLGITTDGTVIHFNKGCEQLTGFTREKVLNKKIWDILIPKNYSHHWKELLDIVTSDDKVDDCVIPWITSQGREKLISWDSLDDKKQGKGSLSEVYFLGECVTDEQAQKIREKTLLNIQKKTTAMKDKEDARHTTDNHVLFTVGNTQLKVRTYTIGEQEKLSESTHVKKVLELEKTIGLNERKLERVTEALKYLAKRHDAVAELVTELEKTDKRLEEKTLNLEKTVHTCIPQDDMNMRPEEQKVTKLQEKKEDAVYAMIKDSTNKDKIMQKNKLRFSFLPLRPKKREEINRQLHDLEERQHHLTSLENQLTDEKKHLDAKKETLRQWKEKLEQLEWDIEQRRATLENEEQALKDRSAKHPLKDRTNIDVSEVPEMTEEEYHTILDKIPESAVVMQRGILKQINKSFADLLGYPQEELLEKQFVDFIAPEGFVELEQYYLNRLKGDDISSCETVFTTKHATKVVVEVSIKPTVYHGERAELAVIKTLKNK